MEFLKKFNLTPLKILKIVGLAIAGLILIILAWQLISATFSSITKNYSPMMGSFSSQESGLDYYGSMKDYASPAAEGSLGLSERNVTGASETISDQVTASGDNAEDFEVTEYSATIETRRLGDTCAKFIELKGRDYVIFEAANQYDTWCSYTFKVKRERAEEILAVIKGLKPKYLQESTYTIKSLLEDYTSEMDILENKMSAINKTLDDAVAAYDSIAGVATRTQDAESLAKIIDSKIKIIERLSGERINIGAELDRLARSKAEQLDRLEYIYFYVDITEDKYIDFKNLKDSWKQAIKNFVYDVNQVIQDISVNLLALLFFVFQYLVYFFIVLILAKYSWRFIKRIWKK